MKLEVRYFASLREDTGLDVEELDVAAGTRVADLWEELLQRHPRLRRVERRSLRVALDQSFADWGDPLDGVEEVAFLPPMSGG